MIYIKRSVDIDKEVTWVAGDLNEETRRVGKLYVGNDVNGAIEASVSAGLDRSEAIFQAAQEIERCKRDEPVDAIQPVGV